MNDFLEDSYCSAMMSAGERINARASKIALIKYNDRVRELLDVEDYLMPSTKSWQERKEFGVSEDPMYDDDIRFYVKIM